MATSKSYTSIEQSKKLAEILPLESADMHYCLENRDVATGYEIGITSFIRAKEFEGKCNIVDIKPAWSLAALFKYLCEIKPQIYTPVLFPSEGKCILQFVKYGYGNVCEVSCNNPVDACVAMIEKLHKLKMLKHYEIKI